MIKDYFIRYGWTLWLGAGFSLFTGYSILNWQWWVFVTPVIVLVVLRR